MSSTGRPKSALPAISELIKRCATVRQEIGNIAEWLWGTGGLEVADSSGKFLHVVAVFHPMFRGHHDS